MNTHLFELISQFEHDVVYRLSFEMLMALQAMESGWRGSESTRRVNDEKSTQMRTHWATEWSDIFST